MEQVRPRVLARLATILVIACLCPATVRAGDFHALLLDASYARPLRWNVGASLFFSPDDVGKSQGGTGIIVGGSVGAGGMQVWGGKELLGGPNIDVRGVVTRTWDNPRGASANATYVGGEVGWGLGWRVSVGYAKRLSGPSTGSDHIITWGVGAEIPWFR
jgi:hypothetical protein